MKRLIRRIELAADTDHKPSLAKCPDIMRTDKCGGEDNVAITTPTVDDDHPPPDNHHHQREPSNETEHFTDIVFSFFSNAEEPRCDSAGNHYEIMASTPQHVHKSEMTFYVSAASLKGGSDRSLNYDVPAKEATSVFITHHKSLNDVNEHYQNSSASLDNLSQVCNVSLHRGASLPEIDPNKSVIQQQQQQRTFNSFNLPKLLHVTKRQHHNAGAKLKNRLSALYTSHRVVKGRKRFSKAWHGIKEWFEAERSKLDKAIHKRKQRSRTPEGGEESDEFSEYEDVDVADRRTSGTSNVSRSKSVCGSTPKLAGDIAKSTKCDNRSRSVPSLRQSRSQPSMLVIGEPVLVKINCESVDGSECDRSSRFDDRSELASSTCASNNGPQKDTARSDAQTINDRGGFIELKTAVKDGSTVCKELYTVLQQRADVERQYATSLSRISARTRRLSKGSSTEVITSKKMATDMEAKAELHKYFSNRMTEDIVRPLQRLVTTRDMTRKQIERDVEITARRLSELRACEARTKKASHSAARFNERVQDTNIVNGLTPSQETDLKKKKIRSDEAAIKSDVEYYMACLRAERARVEWETTVKKCSETLVTLEDDRLDILKQTLKQYTTLVQSLGQKSLEDEAFTLEENFNFCMDREKHTIRDLLIQPPSSMHLPDFYCQHITLAMNKERRKQALMRILQLIKIDMERERKSKQALEKLSQAITTTPNFGGNDSQQNVSEKLYHMRSVLTYLEGARIQAAGTLSELYGRGRAPHPLSPHLKVARDRRGLQHTTLTVPPWLQFEYKGHVQSTEEDRITNSPPSTPTSPTPISRSSDRGAADGVSIQHYSDIDDSIEEFSLPLPPKKIDLSLPPKMSEFVTEKQDVTSF